MDEGVLKAARAIRAYLADLVGPAAGELDNRIAGLLAAARRGQDVSGELRSLLNSHEATQSFLDAVLADRPHYRPPSVQPDQLRDPGYSPLAGDMEPVLHAGEYSCPYRDFVWYRLAVGEPLPPCPTHGPGLTRT